MKLIIDSYKEAPLINHQVDINSQLDTVFTFGIKDSALRFSVAHRVVAFKIKEAA